MTPEQIVKHEIYSYLETRSDVFFWSAKSVGIFDHKRGIFRKNRGRHEIKGVSDILAVINNSKYRGRILAIEVKSKTGRVSPEQKDFLEQIVSRGGLALVARSAAEVMAYLSLHIS